MRPPETRLSVLQRLGRGDEAAWADLDASYRDSILSYCRAHGLQWADAEDVRQQVMTSLLGALRSFRYDPDRGRFRDYLARIVSNAARRHRGRRWDREVGRLDTAACGALRGPQGEREPVWQHEWMDHHLRIALGSLRGIVRQDSLAIFEQLLAGRSVADVARASETTEQRVHKVKQRVRRRLQERVAFQIRAEEEAAWAIVR